ncbi:MAG: metalloregulator ArsR/SmtB family transcription factor [Chloroflexi bacterium]|jgi:DNA-binding transcriptional ArsR family regulator|nr:metalloregulator ArsR/SmtB family transcription factor [Chloroflexota bacterium]
MTEREFVQEEEAVADACCHDGATCVALGEEEARALADTFTALADPTRVRLISALAEGEVCVTVLAEALGMTVSAVSHQLRLLRQLRTVAARREGRHIYYSLADEHIARMYQYALEHSQEGRSRDDG